jgi:HK97 family phage major capsid protein
MNTSDLLESSQIRLSELIKSRQPVAALVSEIRGKLSIDDTAVSDTDAKSASDKLRSIDAEIDVLSDRIKEFSADLARERAVERMQAELSPVISAQRADRAPVSVIREERTYNPDSARNGVSFFQDVFAMRANDMRAKNRIERHAQEVEVEKEQRTATHQRAVGSGAFAGLVVPQYIVSEATSVLRRGRPLVEIVRKAQLPSEGMVLVVPRQTGGNPVAVQAAQNTSVNDTNAVWSDVSVPVVTIAGQSQISFQSIQRGTLNLDELTYQDMVLSYAEEQDRQVISGSGAGGQMLGIRNSGGSAATPFGAPATWPLINSKVAGAIAAMAAAGTAVRPRVVVMHPRRWAFYTAALDNANRPLALFNGAGIENAAALLQEGGAYSGDPGVGRPPEVVGFLHHNLPVITDGNIPTNIGAGSAEDQIYVLDVGQHIFWQDGDGMPTQLKFQNFQVAGQAASSLTESLVVYGYSAFTAARQPLATSIVGGLDATAGNGLIAPAF